jgi:hypothetical protein
MNKKIVLGSLTAAVISLGVVGSAFAYQGDSNVQGPNYSPERHTAMTAAFETGNYNSWKELMSGKGRVTQIINETNFTKFAEAHKLAVNGDVAGASTIRAELGLGQGSKGKGMKTGNGQGQSKGRGMNNSGARGQNIGGSFVDANGDGTCDNL